MLTGADGTVIGMVQLFAGGGSNVFFVAASANAFNRPAPRDRCGVPPPPIRVRP
jgi:hypothetical protein